MEVIEAINTRRSVRSYEDRPVERERIEAALQAALMAPSGQNRQPVRFWVIQDAPTLADLERDLYAQGLKLKKMLWLLGAIVPQFKHGKGKRVFTSLREKLFNGAPALVLIGADVTASSTHKKDCTLAAENFMLAALDQGLSTCYIGWTVLLNRMPSWKKRLHIPKTTEIVDGIILGHSTPPAKAPSRNPLSDVTTWIGAMS